LAIGNARALIAQKHGSRLLTVDEDIARAQPFMEKEGFFERESARRIEHF